MIGLEPLNGFLIRSRQMNSSRAKELRLTQDEVQQLALCLGQLTARQTELLEQVVAMQKEINALNKPIVLEINGGKL